MPKITLVFALFVVITIACSGGSRDARPPAPPPNPPKAPAAINSMQELLLSLRSQMCALRPVPGTSHWTLEFQKSISFRPMEVAGVATDFVRLKRDRIHFDIPFSAIILVTSDD